MPGFKGLAQYRYATSCYSSATARSLLWPAKEARGRASSNADMGAPEIRAYCQLDGAGEALMKGAVRQLNLSARGYHRMLRLARAIADLAGVEPIGPSRRGDSVPAAQGGVGPVQVSATGVRAEMRVPSAQWACHADDSAPTVQLLHCALYLRRVGRADSTLQELPVMIQSLLGTLGMLGILFGVFGFALAGSWLCGGCPSDATDIRGNARLLLVTGTTLLVFAVANTV